MKIAIDGPAGSGKSTVAKKVAQILGFKHIDTGAFYRWVTVHALESNIALTDTVAVTDRANKLDYTHIDESAIRTPAVAKHVSAVAAIASVRTSVVAQQRLMAASYDVVMEGRDIGSVVFPDAELKIFLTASVDERAQRRYKEQVAKGIDQSLSEIQADIIKRDYADSTRAASPLKKMPDAVELDTTGLTIDQVVAHIVTLAKERI